MSIWRIEPEHGWNTKFKAMSREQYAACRADLSDAYELDEWKEDKEEPPYFYGTKTLVTEHEMIAMTRHGLSFRVVAFKQGYFANSLASEKNVSHDTHIHVTVPNIGLLMIDEVTWREDECTQSLQSELDDGWRILAVCPPNGDRRPTYILGRTKRE